MRGMVRKKNVLSVLMQVFATVCVLTLVWMIVGYSLGVQRTATPYDRRPEQGIPLRR